MIQNLKNLKFKFNIMKVILDFGYSILASVISVGIVQLVLYPMLARSFNSTEYGQLLTVMGIVNTVSMSLGNTLNNTRLIQNTKYSQESIKGDFNIILSVTNIVGFIVIILIGNIFFTLDLKINILLSVLVILLSSKAYLIVGYRLKLNFKLNFLSSIVSSVGYLIGVFIANYTSIWPIAFITSEICSIVFLLCTVDLYKEPYKITKLFGETINKYLLLALSGLMGNLLIYLDRLIIYPILGGEFVSAYTTAAFFGKSLGIIMTPIAGLLLGYYAQQNFKMTIKRFWFINAIVIIASVLFFFFAWVFSPWVTGLLYPTIIDIARPYIFLANTASIISVVASMTQPSVLKYAPTYWQVVKEIVYGVVYIGLGFLFINKYGLLGFCVAAICANSIRLIMLYVIGSKYIGQSKIEGVREL